MRRSRCGRWAWTALGLLLLCAPRARAQIPYRPASAADAPPPLLPPVGGARSLAGAPPGSASGSAPPAAPVVTGLPGELDGRTGATDLQRLGADGRLLGADGRVVWPPPLEEPLDPERYPVDKGDVLQARVWGAQNFDLSLPVDADGRLFIPRIGYVIGHGRSLAAVSAEIVHKLGERFPKLQAAVTLATPRNFLVRVTGAVGNPGMGVQVNAWTRASEAVTRAGGVIPAGSSRRIELHRQGGAVEPVDLALFPLFGDRSRDPVLRDGDWLHVPLAERQATVQGGVNRPGTYELLEGTFQELLRLCGGLSPEADDRLSIRVASVDAAAEGERGAPTVRLLGFQRAHPEALTGPLHHHDLVAVPTVDEGPRVFARGALGAQVDASARVDPRVADLTAAAREITLALPFIDGETVRGLVRKAGGLAPWADLGNAWIERLADAATGDRARPAGAAPAAVRKVDGERRAVIRIPVDLQAVFTDGDRRGDLPLRAGDTLFVPSARTDVLVSGHVMKPGVYGYSMRLSAGDYLALAGGETRDGARGRARVVSVDGRSRSLNEAAPLQPGDSIVVPGKVLTAAEWGSISLGLVSVGLSSALLGYNLSHH